MGVNALSLQLQTNRPAEAVRRLSSHLGRLQRPAGLIGFVSGTLSSTLQSLSEQWCRQVPGLPAFFASSDGVFSDQGELEDQDGLVCLLLGGSKLAVRLADELTSSAGATVVEPSQVSPESLRSPAMILTSGHWGLPEDPAVDGQPLAHRWGWFGAVTSSDARLWGVDADGQIQSGTTGLVAFTAAEEPLLFASTCCRLISPPMVVSAFEGNTVFELDGVPALVALGQASSKLVDRSWIVVATALDKNSQATVTDGSPALVFRPIRGVDPARGAIILTEPARAGMELAFAVRDDRASRRSLEDALRGARQGLCGSVPRFGIYFDGLGRGRSLYGAPNVDLGQIRHVLGEFPILGMRSAFELRGGLGYRGIQSLTGQLALFRNAS